jgi:predicted Zn finger-like uncharacterized protein
MMGSESQIKCPHCGQTYFVQPEQWAQYLGQTINCTRCGREFQVTAPAARMPAMPQVQPYAAPMSAAPAQSHIGPVSPFQQTVPYYPDAPVPISGWAITSLVSGILGLCIPFVPLFALTAALIGLSRIKRGRASGRGLAIAGLIIGIIGVAINALILLSILAGQNSTP